MIRHRDAQAQCYKVISEVPRYFERSRIPENGAICFVSGVVDGRVYGNKCLETCQNITQSVSKIYIYV